MVKTEKFIIILFLFFSFSLFPKTVESENYRLEINENTGIFRFASTVNGDEYLYLFSDKTPETTSISVFEDKSFYPIGDSSHFQLTFTGDEYGGIILAKSDKLSVQEEIHFVGKGVVKIELSIKNTSQAVVRSGLKFLLDNCFEVNDRFLIDHQGTISKVNSEWEDENVQQLNSWTATHIEFTPIDKNPERLITGNWQRLNEAGYSFGAVPGRNFNNHPYGRNDSAILHLYGPEDILPGNSLHYAFQLKAVGFNEQPENTESPAIEEKTKEQPIETPETETEVQKPQEEKTDISSDKTDDSITQSLETIGKISTIIDMLYKPGMVTDSNMDTLEDLIKDLEEKKSDENTQ